MKIREAQQAYRAQRQALLDQRRQLMSQQKALERKASVTADGKAVYAEEAATLELSINANKEMFDKNQSILDQLAEQYALVWNAEASRQQSDAMQEYAEDMAKIMEVARRIAKGGRVPASDEQKVMEYSMELYMAAKNAAMLNEMKEKEEYDSLWKDDEEKGEEYDPQDKAENAEVNIALPESIDMSAGAAAGTEEITE